MNIESIPQKLFNLAKLAQQRAYAPYSDFKVGAAIYSNHQQFYSGCNVENISYPCGTCAEAGAISAMIAGGDEKISEILIIADGSSLITPCGACLQRIKEFADDNILIHLANSQSIAKTLTLKDLLPIAFDDKDLHK